MAGEGVKLYGFWVSPFSMRVELALKIKGVDYEYIEEDLQNKSPELLQYNPVHKKVPVLVHNGKAIAESQVILEYIDETWKENPIMPQDPYERAMARFWAKFIHEKCVPSFRKALLGGETEVEKGIEETKENLMILEKVLEGKSFFGGERIGFVDIVANVIAYWVFLYQEAVEKEVLTEEFSVLCNWKDKYVNHSIIKETLPPKDKSVAYYRARFAQSKASS
ncbi:hypothetical protein Nepgr_012031 [Nepenthes gracilis]|uniref:glutathione transferase n=1 Tax=Nepenthes gracilis TaxID=150966 RepID=A0AAD3SF40_NEPGR|nr:hypothetical protein Nepgr_012031 [Nepenthes gracilis]